MSRKLVIDGQIFQTPALYRGMGKYSLELLAVLAKATSQGSWDAIELILSKHLDSDDEFLRSVRETAPNVNVVMINLSPNDFRNSRILPHNRRVVDDYLESSSNEDDEIDFLILSITQTEIFPCFPDRLGVHKVLLCYDLIPLLFYDVYLDSPVTQRQYLAKMPELFNADTFLTISQTVANDLAIYTGIDKRRITNIDGGPINHGNSDDAKHIKAPTPFILMPTGNDLRKNNRRAVLGFNEFNKIQGGKYSLVITSFFTEEERVELSALAANVHFTGNISGVELDYLYEQSVGLLFPSEYEGLGLPILEAVSKSKPIACSNIAVFREMSETAFNYFEPGSILEIERALNVMVQSPDVDLDTYQKIIDRYKWDRTSSVAVETIVNKPKHTKSKEKPRVAVFGPDTSLVNDSSKLLQYCAAELGKFCEPEYFLAARNNQSTRRINYLPYAWPTTTVENGFLFKPEEFEEIFYFLSDDSASAPVLITALANPGVVILQDTVLDKLWSSLRGNDLISHERYFLEAEINTRFKTEGVSFLASILSTQKTIVVFSEYQKKLVETLAKSINSKVRVYLMHYPLGNLVYPDALPAKNIKIGERFKNQLAANGKPIATKTDLQYNEVLSKMHTVIMDPDSSLYDELEAMRFNTIVFHKSEDDRNTPTQSFKSVDEARKKAETLNKNSDKSKLIQRAMSEYVHENSFETFINEIEGIIGK